MAKKEKKKKEKVSELEKQIVIVNNISPPMDENQLRAINLYGDITETRAQETIGGLLYLESTAPKLLQSAPNFESDDPVVINQDMKMFISTNGGNVSDMFSIVDVMGMIKKNTCDIETVGVGKVMSAGVPILASGTKGKRKIGRNCRIMLHGVAAMAGGSIFRLENELEEIRWIQEKYIECLTACSKLTKPRIRKMIKSQKDVYISAEDAVKYGIVDEII